jgi:hypothetical protein
MKASRTNTMKLIASLSKRTPTRWWFSVSPHGAPPQSFVGRRGG